MVQLNAVLLIRSPGLQCVTSLQLVPSLHKEENDIYFPGLLRGLKTMIMKQSTTHVRSFVAVIFPNRRASHPPLFLGEGSFGSGGN